MKKVFITLRPEIQRGKEPIFQMYCNETASICKKCYCPVVNLNLCGTLGEGLTCKKYM